MNQQLINLYSNNRTLIPIIVIHKSTKSSKILIKSGRKHHNPNDTYLPIKRGSEKTTNPEFRYTFLSTVITIRAPFGRDSTCRKKHRGIDPLIGKKELGKIPIFSFLWQVASDVETWGQDGRKEPGTSARPWTTVFIPRESSRRAELVFVRLKGRIGRTKGGEGWRRERRDRDERSTGHTRVLPRALQVLQCRPVPAWVSGSSSSSSSLFLSGGGRRRRWFSYSRLDRVIATAYTLPQDYRRFPNFAGITRYEPPSECRRNCLSRWRLTSCGTVSTPPFEFSVPSKGERDSVRGEDKSFR